MAPQAVAQGPTDGRTVLLDTNLLVLLCVGSYRLDLVRRHPRSKQFVESDYMGLLLLLERARTLVTTQPILVEASNLLRTERAHAAALLALLRHHTAALDEFAVATRVLFEKPAYFRFGVTDACIEEAARSQGCMVLTADRELCDHLSRSGIEATNFNWLRGSWLTT